MNYNRLVYLEPDVYKALEEALSTTVEFSYKDSGKFGNHYQYEVQSIILNGILALEVLFKDVEGNLLATDYLYSLNIRPKCQMDFYTFYLVFIERTDFVKNNPYQMKVQNE